MEAFNKTVFLMTMLILAFAVSTVVWTGRFVSHLVPKSYGRPIDKGW